MADYSIFSGAAPTSTSRTDGPYTLGTEFTVTATSWAKAFRFRRPDTTAQTVTGKLYEVTDTAGTVGTLISSTVTFTLSGTGWQQAAITTPIRLDTGKVYRVAIRATRFYEINNYWTSGTGANGITSGTLRAPSRANARGNMQSSFLAGQGDGYPSSGSGSGQNWFADLLVTDIDPNPTPSTPKSGAFFEFFGGF